MEVKENGSEMIIHEYFNERIKCDWQYITLDLRYRSLGLKCRIINK
jgi:hypothetical protein